jgi:hypothetical protein
LIKIEKGIFRYLKRKILVDGADALGVQRKMMFRSVESGRSNFIFPRVGEDANFSVGIRIKMNDAPVCLPRIDPLAGI